MKISRDLKRKILNVVKPLHPKTSQGYYYSGLGYVNECRCSSCWERKEILEDMERLLSE